MAGNYSAYVLPVLSSSVAYSFSEPCKKINGSEDVSAFLTSRAYTDIMTFLLQLNRSMFPVKSTSGDVQTWSLNSDAVELSSPVQQLQALLRILEEIIDEAPPDKGPRRFGNTSFRKWLQIVESRASDLLEGCLSHENFQGKPSDSRRITAKAELKAYFLGSWGSAQRLDYGTGHELSFLAFLGCLWKLGGFRETAAGVEERAIVLGVLQPYFMLVRTLIKTYTLEPAGSHGVWGLDDHSFIPYIFGSAQLSPAVPESGQISEEGSLLGAPDPRDVTEIKVVEKERDANLYFSAIGFIYDVKKGPFWEHSPVLYDISGIQAGWAKINKGMIKMYNAEVLSKFPVVQHFPFGTLFSWERDPNASPPAFTHITPGSLSQPRNTASVTRQSGPTTGNRSPWVTAHRPAQTLGATAAPWITKTEGRPNMSHPDLRRPLFHNTSISPGLMVSAKTDREEASSKPAPGDLGNAQTKAPWARS